MVFPVLIPGQNFLFPGTGREIKIQMPREGKFEACNPLIHGKWDFSLTPVVQVAVGHQAMTTHCTFMASRGARPSLEGQQQPDAKKL